MHNRAAGKTKIKELLTLQNNQVGSSDGLARLVDCLDNEFAAILGKEFYNLQSMVSWGQFHQLVGREEKQFCKINKTKSARKCNRAQMSTVLRSSVLLVGSYLPAAVISRILKSETSASFVVGHF